MWRKISKIVAGVCAGWGGDDEILTGTFPPALLFQLWPSALLLTSTLTTSSHASRICASLQLQWFAYTSNNAFTYYSITPSSWEMQFTPIASYSDQYTLMVRPQMEYYCRYQDRLLRCEQAAIYWNHPKELVLIVRRNENSPSKIKIRIRMTGGSKGAR